MAHGARIALHSSRAARRVGAAFAIGMHALVGAVLVTYEPARSALLSAAPIMVSLITPSRPDAKPVETPPRPKPVVRPQPKPPEPLPFITAPAEAPSPSPILAAPPPPPPGPAPVAAALEPAITAPIFAADYLDNPPPVYPALSRRVGEQGSRRAARARQSSFNNTVTLPAFWRVDGGVYYGSPTAGRGCSSTSRTSSTSVTTPPWTATTTSAREHRAMRGYPVDGVLGGFSFRRDGRLESAGLQGGGPK